MPLRAAFHSLRTPWRCVALFAATVCVAACSGSERPPSLSGDAAVDARGDISTDRADAFIECVSDLDCDDRVGCTLDRCVRGRCDHEPQSTRCGGGGRCDPVAGCIGQRPCASDRDCPDDPCGVNEQCDPLAHVCTFEELPANSPCGASGRLCRGGACVCPMGRSTACGEACVDVATDPSHCGACGNRCGAGAWCAAGRCTCSQPQTHCNGVCVDTAADPANCGACGSRCPAGSRCEMGLCRTPCGPSMHRCGETCVSDSAPASCGTSCTPCPTPPHGIALCSSGVCTLACTAGFHPCGMVCADDTSVATCGASCSPCPTDSHGTVACVAGACRATCAAGYHACGGVCAPNDAVGSCGTSCTPCPTPPGGDPVCTAGRCDFTCREGFHRCGDVCSDGTSPLGCGPSCTRCPVPDNGAATCTAGACGRTCRLGFHLCGEQCLNDNAPDSCGSRCAPCPVVEHGAGECVTGVCTFRCDAGYVREGDRCRALPRLIAPRSTARLTGRRPSLAWQLPTDATEGEVQLCRDRLCATVLRTLPASAGTATVTEDLPPGMIFWRVRVTGDSRVSPTWSFRVPNHSTPVTTFWGSTQDSNGDGFGELIVSRPFTGAGGSVFVQPGAPAGMSSSIYELADEVPAAYFGQCLAFGNDLDGDGYGDLVVGAPGHAMSQGRVAIYRGGASGYARAASQMLLGTYGADTFFGNALAAGDFDGDGFSDVAIGAYAAAGSSGRVEIHRGGAEGLSLTPASVLSGATGSRFGIALSALGDVNGDGYEDLAVGADGAAGFLGRVFVYLGSPRGLATVSSAVLSNTEGGQFGLTITAAGDLNGDGYPDVAVGAPEALGYGRVYVYTGAATGLDTTAWSVLNTAASMDGAFGTGLGGVGDVNADGYDDLVVGAPRTNTSEGLALLYPGGASMLGASVRLAGATGARPYFGNTVGGARDLDGDGFDDVLVGAERYMAFLGQVSVFRGAPTGTLAPTILTPPPGGLSGRFGFAISQ